MRAGCPRLHAFSFWLSVPMENSFSVLGNMSVVVQMNYSCVSVRRSWLFRNNQVQCRVIKWPEVDWDPVFVMRSCS